jgi:hypothetical protein
LYVEPVLAHAPAKLGVPKNYTRPQYFSIAALLTIIILFPRCPRLLDAAEFYNNNTSMIGIVAILLNPLTPFAAVYKKKAAIIDNNIHLRP